MVQKQGNTTTLPGVFSTVSAGFELTTRFLWLMILPAVLDLFLWIGPRLSFRSLIETVLEGFFAQLPTGAMAMDPQPLLEMATRLNHFSYLSVSFLGIPTLMSGLTPEKTPVIPVVIEGNGWGAWIGYLILFTLSGLLLSAVYYNLIAYALRRSLTATDLPPLGPARFVRRVLQTWLRLIALAALIFLLVFAITLPVTLLAGFLALISQAIATFALLGAVVLMIWLIMFLSFTPYGMVLNPRPFAKAVADSVRLFQSNMPASLGLLLVVILARQLLGFILLSADSGTWITAINILAHAYITTALTAAMFIFYRDRFVAHLKTNSPPATEQVQQ